MTGIRSRGRRSKWRCNQQRAGPSGRPVDIETTEVQFMVQLQTVPVGEEELQPRPEHKFTFGLWTVGNKGGDPFGTDTRAAIDPEDSVRKLAELGAYGISLHDNDLGPFGASAAERDRIVSRFKKTLEETGL